MCALNEEKGMKLSMKINYLFSGIDKERGFNEVQSKYLKEDVKENLNIVFIASIFYDFERNDEQHIRILNWFKKIGINFNNSYLIDNRIEKEEAKRLIENSNIVYLMGGSPELQMKSINEYGLKKYIKKVDMVIGVSAGSMNQSKRVVYKDEYQNNEIFDYEGLDLVDINIYPHLDWNNIDLVKENFEISLFVHLISLPNDSFIRIKNEEKEYIGDYYEIDNGTINIKGAEYEKINHLGSIELETERLLLRKTTMSDIEEFFYIQLNPKLRKFLGSTKLGSNLEKDKKYFAESKYNNLDYYRWTMVKKEDNKILGTIYLNIHDEKAKVAGIDYWIREDEWSKGYVTEAAKCVLDFGFQELNLNRIESSGARNNLGTWKVMEKIGLKYEGTRKQAFFYYYGGVQDLVLYGLTKEEYFDL